MQLCPKIQDIGVNMPLYVFLSHIYVMRYHTSREKSLKLHECISLNVILYNSSVNKELILC